MDDSVTYGYSYYQNQSTMVINSNSNSNHTTTTTTTTTNNNNNNNNSSSNNGNNISQPGSNEPKDDFSDCVSSGEDSIRDISVQGDIHGFIPSRKQRAFTPDNRKDQCYWEKRRKNNEAARRSREKRRLHDMALEKRIVELSRESCILRTQLHAVKKRYGIPREEPILLDNEEQEILDKDLQALNAASASAAAPVASPIPPNAVLSSLKIRRASPVGLPLVSSTGSNSAASVPNVTNNNNDTRSVIFSLPNNSETHSGNISAPATISTMKGHKNSTVATTLSSIQHQYGFEPTLTVKQEPVDDFNSTVLNTSESQGSVDYPSSESYTTSSETFEATTSALMMGKESVENHINSGKSLENSWYHSSREPMDNGKLVSAAGDLEQKPLQLVVKRRKVEPEHFAHSQEPIGEYHKSINTTTTTTNNTNNNNHLHYHQQSQQQQQQLPPQQKSPVISPMVPSPHTLSISESPILRTSISTLPLKLRHKVSLPDHTMSTVQLSSPTATVTSLSPSSSSFSSASAFSQNEASTTPSALHNGLTQLSEIALSHSNPLPLLKKDVVNGVGLLTRCNGSNSSSSNSSLDGNMNDIGDLDMKPNEHEMLSRLDPKYVERRKRNNEAARKCRENRKALTKMREVKSSYLESENGKLRNEMNDLQEEVKQLRELLEKKRLEQGFKGKLSDADHNNSITINT